MDARETTGTPEFRPTTREVRAAFTEEITAVGGEVRDAFDDGTRLFLRAVLPAAAQVRPGDPVQGGVALRTAGPEVLVHPYIFRQVCTNGAIQAQALDTRRVARVERTELDAPSYEVVVALDALRDAVQACAAPTAFQRGVAGMRSALEVEGDAALMLLPWLLRSHGSGASRVAAQILHRFAAAPDPDRSAFGLMNAVTSVARDTRDPELRWRLEELGGAIPARLPRRPTAAPTAAALALV